MVAPSKTLQISQTFAAAQDAEHGHEQEIPGRESNPAPHPGVWVRVEEADQIEIGCIRAGFGHREGARPLSEPKTDNSDRGACEAL